MVTNIVLIVGKKLRRVNMARILSKEEREKIKEAKQKERLLNGYIAGAVAHMTPKRRSKKMRGGVE